MEERFLLRRAEGGAATELVYQGELGTDGWALGAWWGKVVAGRWERAVVESMEALKVTSEAKAARHEQRRG